MEMVGVPQTPTDSWQGLLNRIAVFSTTVNQQSRCTLGGCWLVGVWARYPRRYLSSILCGRRQVAANSGSSVTIMYWECPECETRVDSYRNADEHDHQVFTKDDAGDEFDIALSPTHPKVTDSLSRRLRFQVKNILRRALPPRKRE